MYIKKAEDEEILARVFDGEVQITNLVQSKFDEQFINEWKEFKTKEEAYTFYQIEQQ